MIFRKTKLFDFFWLFDDFYMILYCLLNGHCRHNCACRGVKNGLGSPGKCLRTNLNRSEHIKNKFKKTFFSTYFRFFWTFFKHFLVTLRVKRAKKLCKNFFKGQNLEFETSNGHIKNWRLYYILLSPHLKRFVNRIRIDSCRGENVRAPPLTTPSGPRVFNFWWKIPKFFL